MRIFLTPGINGQAYTILLFLVLHFFSFKSSAQDKLIKGTVYDSAGNTLPWVNIGIRYKNIGTLSKDSGDFELQIPTTFLNDTLLFSFVGFQELRIPVQELIEAGNNKVVLYEKAYAVNEVVITNKKRKKVTLGTKGYTPLLWVSISLRDKKDYAEQGQLIKITKPSQLLNVNARVGSNRKSKDSVTYRLNIYKVENGLPGERLIEKNIIQSFPAIAKTITFDLQHASIFLEEPCIVAFEYIPKKNSHKLPALSFRASIGGTGGFSRAISTGKWEPMHGGSGSIFVEVEQ